MDEIIVYDKIMIQKSEKEKIWKLKTFYINIHLKDRYKWNSKLAKAT